MPLMRLHLLYVSGLQTQVLFPHLMVELAKRICLARFNGTLVAVESKREMNFFSDFIQRICTYDFFFHEYRIWPNTYNLSCHFAALKPASSFITSGKLSYGKLIWDIDHGRQNRINIPSWMDINNVDDTDDMAYLVVNSHSPYGIVMHGEYSFTPSVVYPSFYRSDL